MTEIHYQTHSCYLIHNKAIYRYIDVFSTDITLTFKSRSQQIIDGVEDKAHQLGYFENLSLNLSMVINFSFRNFRLFRVPHSSTDPIIYDHEDAKLCLRREQHSRNS